MKVTFLLFLLLPLSSAVHWLVGDCGNYSSIADLPLADGDVVEYCPNSRENGSISFNGSLAITGGPVEANATIASVAGNLTLENLSLTTRLSQYTYAFVVEGNAFLRNINWSFDNASAVGGYPLYYGYSSLLYAENGSVVGENISTGVMDSSPHFRSFSVVKGNGCLNVSLSRVSHRAGYILHYLSPSCQPNITLSHLSVVGGGIALLGGEPAIDAVGGIENFSCLDTPPTYTPSFRYDCIAVKGNFSGKIANGYAFANVTVIDGYGAGLGLALGLWSTSAVVENLTAEGRFRYSFPIYLDPNYYAGGSIKANLSHLSVKGNVLALGRRGAGEALLSFSHVYADGLYIRNLYTDGPSLSAYLSLSQLTTFDYQSLSPLPEEVALTDSVIEQLSLRTDKEGPFNATLSNLSQLRSLSISSTAPSTHMLRQLTFLPNPFLYLSLSNGSVHMEDVTLPLLNNTTLIISRASFSPPVSWSFTPFSYEAKPYLFILHDTFNGSGYIVWHNLCKAGYLYRLWGSNETNVSTLEDVMRGGSFIGMASCSGGDLWARVPSFS